MAVAASVSNGRCGSGSIRSAEEGPSRPVPGRTSVDDRAPLRQGLRFGRGNRVRAAQEVFVADSAVPAGLRLGLSLASGHLGPLARLRAGRQADRNLSERTRLGERVGE